MNFKKPLLIGGIVSGVALASLAGVGAVSAESATSNGRTSLITKIAQKFNLKEEEVKAVFDEDHAARESEMQSKVEERLNQAVTNGKITAAQKDKIIAKQKELHTAREANRDAMHTMSSEERKAAMEAERTELEKWAEENDIPLEYLRMAHGGRGHGGMGPR